MFQGCTLYNSCCSIPQSPETNNIYSERALIYRNSKTQTNHLGMEKACTVTTHTNTNDRLTSTASWTSTHEGIRQTDGAIRRGICRASIMRGRSGRPPIVQVRPRTIVVRLQVSLAAVISEADSGIENSATWSTICNLRAIWALSPRCTELCTAPKCTQHSPTAHCTAT